MTSNFVAPSDNSADSTSYGLYQLASTDSTEANYAVVERPSEDRINEVIDEIRDMLMEKNRKYGDSALNPTRIFAKSDSIEQIRVRIDDKLSRLRNLQDDEDEDIILDLMGYLILLRVATIKENEEPCEAETPNWDVVQWLKDLEKAQNPYVTPYQPWNPPYQPPYPGIQPWNYPTVTWGNINTYDDGHFISMDEHDGQHYDCASCGTSAW